MKKTAKIVYFLSNEFIYIKSMICIYGLLLLKLIKRMNVFLLDSIIKDQR